ncbi:MAG: extracellular solute-binding protein [Oscillospiraceae bacterium]|nr:extracellular solute-binding protein [Oscillospiraceae bacterium]
MKKYIALLLALVMVLGLVACGGKTDEKITLKVIAAQYGGKTAEWWVGFEKDFEAANQNIDLVVDVPSWNDIYTVVNTRISNNDAPDILNIDVFADYQADGLLLPVSEWCSEETYAKFYPQFIEQSVVDGTVWAVPDLASARALYYNADLLAAAGVEVPTTWGELKVACEAIKASNPDIYPWGVDMTTDEGQACFAYYAWTNGGGFVDASGNWTLNSAENVEAVEFVLDLINSGLTNSSPTTETRYDLQEMFAAGKLAMMIGPNQISTYVASTENPINFGVASIPANEGKATSSVGVMDRFMVFDNDHSDAKMEAITKFFDFFYEDTRYSDWVIMEDFLPATTTGGDIMVAANPAAAAWLEVVGSAQFYPTAKAEWADVKQGVINVQQQALTTGASVQELLNALQTEIAG